MKRHLIALDLDGTLLNDKKTISPYTKQVLQAAMDQGHIVMIATGRSRRTSIQYYRELHLNTPMVNFNGAFIHHPYNDTWESLHQPIQRKAALDVIDACYDLNVHNIIVKVQDQIYLDQHDEEVINIFQSVATKKEFSPLSIGKVSSKLKEDPTTLLIIPQEKNIDGIRSHLETHHSERIDHRNWGAPWHITELTRKGIHKAVGVKKVADFFNIPREQIIAFGDEDNDLEMIDYAGVGVAMENGIRELQDNAKHITETNEEDGVGKFLESYLNIQIPVS